MNRFTVGQPVRYKPGFGTYGYEGVLGDDGRVPGVVRGFTETRVRVELTMDRRRIGGPVTTITRAVDAKSLVLAESAGKA